MACCQEGSEIVRGQVFYHDRAVANARVYIDCYACSLDLDGWASVAYRQTSATGAYALVIRPEWEGTRYRATLLEPNFGWVRAPDMRVLASSTQ